MPSKPRKGANAPLPRKRGQQPKINPKRAQKFLENVASGQYIDTAAAMAGVHPTTAMRWVKVGEDAIAAAEARDSEADVILADWLDQFTADFKADNPMWFMDPPEAYDDPETWIYALFAQLYQRARAVAEASALGNIRTAARAGNWQADAWYLERTRHEKYGRREVIQRGADEDEAVTKFSGSGVSDLLARVQAITEQEAKAK